MWEQLDLGVLELLSETMPHRAQAISKSDSWYTKYQSIGKNDQVHENCRQSFVLGIPSAQGPNGMG